MINLWFPVILVIIKHSQNCNLYFFWRGGGRGGGDESNLMFKHLD